MTRSDPYDGALLPNHNGGRSRLIYLTPVGNAAGGLLMALSALLAIISTADIWVYSDAKSLADRGTPVTAAIGALTIDTPVKWSVACLLLCELFPPVYFENRR